MKPIFKTILLILSIAISVILVTSIFLLLESFKYGLLNPHIYSMFSDKSGTRHAVIFNQGALQGDSLYFGVIDESKSEPNLIILGPINYTDTSFHLMSVIISADNSVVATECHYGFNGGDLSYLLAYDFTNSISYGSERGPIYENTNLINERNKAIQDLIQSRGGITPLISDTIGFSFFNKGNKLSWLAWKRWQKQVQKAMEKCKP